MALFAGCSGKHLKTASALHAKGDQEVQRGEHGTALEHFRQAYDIRQKILGPHHRDTYQSLWSMVSVYAKNRQFKEALPFAQQMERSAPKIFVEKSDRGELAKLYGALIVIYQSCGMEEDKSRVGGHLGAMMRMPVGKELRAYFDVPDVRQSDTKTNNPIPEDLQGKAKEMQAIWAAQQRDQDAMIIQMRDDMTALLKEKYGYSDDQIRDFAASGIHQNPELLFLLAFTTNKTASGPSRALPKPGVEQENIVRAMAAELSARGRMSGQMLTRAMKDRSRSLEAKFQSDWEEWNQEFEKGDSFNEALGKKRRKNPFTFLPSDAEENPAAMSLFVLNLKGLLLDRELRLQSAIAQTPKSGANDIRARLAEINRRVLELKQELLTEREAKRMGDRGPKASFLDVPEMLELQDTRKRLRTEAMRLPGAGRRKIISQSDISSRLGRDSALVEFVRYGNADDQLIEERYGAVIFTSREEPKWVGLGIAKDIDELIGYYTKLLQQKAATAPSDSIMEITLQKLYDDVWAPVERSLSSEIRSVLLVPDGSLHNISFYTLSRGQRFLGEKVEIRYLSAGRDLLNKKLPRDPDGAVEIWAAPDYDMGLKPSVQRLASNEDSSRGFLSRRLAQLEGARRERVTLEHLFRKSPSSRVQVYEGSQATEGAFAGMAHTHIVHIATHGFFIPVADSTRPSWSIGAQAEFDVALDLYRSGIAFCGANETLKRWEREFIPPDGDDGIITAAEASGLYLNGTWLLTLSACDTGVGGMAAGESALCLRMGFLQAGAQSVLSTLWRVDDNYTEHFMKLFYTAVINGDAPDTALLKTQRSELRRLSSAGDGPALWRASKLVGGFILTSRS